MCSGEKYHKHKEIIPIKVQIAVAFRELEGGGCDWKGEQRGASGVPGKILLLDSCGGYKGVYLIIIHQVVHLFCMFFCLSYFTKKRLCVFLKKRLSSGVCYLDSNPSSVTY